MDIPCEARRATPEDVAFLADAFNRYRQFFGEQSDLPRARAYVCKRLEQKDSVFLISSIGKSNFGFAQLAPGHSPLATTRALQVTALYARRMRFWTDQVEALLREACKEALQAGFHRVEIPSWGYDPFMVYVMNQMGGTHLPKPDLYFLEFAPPDRRHEPLETPIYPEREPRVPRNPRPPRKDRSRPLDTYTFYFRHGPLLEGWAIRNGFEMLEHIHGSDAWTAYWELPTGGRAAMDIDPRDNSIAHIRCRWIGTEKVKETSGPKMTDCGTVDLTSKEALGNLDAWVRSFTARHQPMPAGPA